MSEQPVVAGLRERVHGALDGAPDLWEASQRLRGGSADLVNDPALPIIWAFEYDFVGPDEPERRATRGVWAPWIETPEGVFPPLLDSIEASVLDLWTGVLDGLDAYPHAVARLNDLLWERKWTDRPDQRARAAIDAYLLSAPSMEEPVSRAQSLARALELARTINDLEREGKVTPEIILWTRRAMAETEPQPGVALPLIEAILRLPEDRQPAELDALLDEAVETYREDPWITQEVLDLKAARLKGGTARGLLRQGQVEAWRRAAEKATGLVKISFLQRALDLARLHGLNETADALRRELQEISPEDLDLKEVSSSVSVSSQQVEEYVEAFIGDSWKRSLERMGAIGPPSGEYEANLAEVEQQIKQFPIQYLVTKIILGPGNIPIAAIQGEEQHREAALIEREATAIALGAHFRAEVLDRIKNRFGTPRDDELTEFFTTPLISEEVAERIGRALALFWESQFDESALVLLPRIESVIRAIVREMGLAIMVEAQGDRPGRVKMLRELLSSLRGRYEESWRRYLVNLLVEPLGTNLRNTHLHGLRASADRDEAAILIHVACHLRLIRLTPQSPPDSSGRQ